MSSTGIDDVDTPRDDTDNHTTPVDDTDDTSEPEYTQPYTGIPTDIMKKFKEDSMVLTRNASNFSTIYFQIDNSSQMESLMRPYFVYDFVIEHEHYVIDPAYMENDNSD